MDSVVVVIENDEFEGTYCLWGESTGDLKALPPGEYKVTPDNRYTYIIDSCGSSPSGEPGKHSYINVRRISPT